MIRWEKTSQISKTSNFKDLLWRVKSKFLIKNTSGFLYIISLLKEGTKRSGDKITGPGGNEYPPCVIEFKKSFVN